MNITGSVTASFTLDEALANGLETGSTGLAESASFSILSGTTAGLCDLKWSKSSTLAASASDTWVLSALADDLGRTIAFARLNVLLIETSATVDGDDLTVGGAATHALASIPTFLVKSLGLELKVALNTTGFLVSAGSADQLKITNSGAHSITYRIALAGRSV